MRDHVFIDISSWNQCPPAMTRNVFAYDLEGKLVRDHLLIDIFSWNQCPPAISHLCISYDIVSVMIVSLPFRVNPATGNLLLSGSMWVHVGSVMQRKCLRIVLTWLQYSHERDLVFPCASVMQCKCLSIVLTWMQYCYISDSRPAKEIQGTAEV